MLKISYRKAEKKDFNLIWEIENSCFNRIDLFKKHQIKHFLRNPNKSIITDIILLENQPIGWACYLTKKSTYFIRLYSVCISPQYRGKGYAKEYLSKRFQTFSDKFKRIYLEVRISNENAKMLYKSLGFKELRILKGYYVNEDGIKMVYNFSPNLK